MKFDKLGERTIMNNRMYATVLAYRNYNDIDVIFEDGYIKKHVQYGNFVQGNINNPYARTVFGVGYIGDVKNPISLPSYKYWYSMIQRCYDPKYHKKHPTYKDCTVHEYFLSFENFNEWYNANYYQVPNEKMQLDKDIIISNNKIYAPGRVIFIPQTINSLFKGHSKNNDLPMGMHYNKRDKKYEAYIGINGRLKHLGRYNTPEQASYIYLYERSKYIKQKVLQYNEMPDFIKEKLIDISEKALWNSNKIGITD